MFKVSKIALVSCALMTAVGLVACSGGGDSTASTTPPKNVVFFFG